MALSAPAAIDFIAERTGLLEARLRLVDLRPPDLRAVLFFAPEVRAPPEDFREDDALRAFFAEPLRALLLRAPPLRAAFLAPPLRALLLRAPPLRAAFLAPPLRALLLRAPPLRAAFLAPP